MGRFNMWLQKFTYGRYGTDCLNKFLLVVCLICIVLGAFSTGRLLRWLGVVLLILAYCRMMSRNFSARAAENQKFMDLTSRFRKDRTCGSYRSGTGYSDAGGCRKTSAKVDKSHKVLRCPSCGGKLRVPKGVGKISITCPHCNLKFVKKV